MSNKLIFLLLFTLLFSVYQFPASDSLWTPSGTIGVNLSQVSFSNWAQGGENTFAWTVITNLGLEYKNLPWSFINKLKVTYGRSKIGTENYKTNENELYLETVLTYKIQWQVDPFFSNTVRTTVTSGFDYKKPQTPRIADFFDPGYISQSLGFSYKREKIFSTRMGIALQETFTNEFRNYSDDPDTKMKAEAFKLETGLESVTDSEFEILENVLYQSKLRLFTRFNALDVWDVRWDNLIFSKINKYLTVSISALMLYEKSMSPKTQLKQALQVGIVYSIF